MSTPPTQSPSEIRSALCQRDLVAQKAFHDWTSKIVARALPALPVTDHDQPATELEAAARLLKLRSRLQTVVALAFAFSSTLAPGPDDDWETMNWAVGVYLAKLLNYPTFSQVSQSLFHPTIADCLHFRLKAWFHPYSPSPGECALYSGDWFGTYQTSEGVLWVAIADIAGHGFGAYTLAAGLPDLWAHHWETSAGQECPVKLLAWLDAQLSALPVEGVYVEAAAARFAPDGTAILVATQNRAIFRTADPTANSWRVVRSDTPAGWLGWGTFSATPEEILSIQLSVQDEVLLGTDGLFGMLGQTGVDELMTRAVTEPLVEVVRELVPVALNNPAKEARDDLTVVVTEYRGGVAIQSVASDDGR